MTQLIITKGLPGSGKSTWARKWVEESPSTRIRVNRDDIRNMLGPYWIPERERYITQVEYSLVYTGLIYGYSVVLDATNFKWEKWKNIATECNAEIVIQDFTDVPLEVCLERDSKREGTAKVGRETIERFFNKYIKNGS